MTEWNADRYHDLSSPQHGWGRRVLERLPLEGHETVLDVGCGTGRLTADIAARVRRGRVVGVDRSPAMLQTAAPWLREHARGTLLVLADAAALPFGRAFDAVFSGATFHWVHDHSALFRSIITVLRPGGRLVAQCGGGPNIAQLLGRAEHLMRDSNFSPFFENWTEPTYFADIASTTRRLGAAGFVDVEVSLEAAPTPFDSAEAFREFIANVCVRHHIARMPPPERTVFLRELTLAAAADSPPFTLDYWRLNISARRPA